MFGQNLAWQTTKPRLASAMKPYLALILSAILCSCETPPVVAPTPNVAAVRTQNVETKKHITNTRTHIDLSQKDEADVDKSLDAAKKHLDDLLNDKN